LRRDPVCYSTQGRYGLVLVQVVLVQVRMSLPRRAGIPVVRPATADVRLDWFIAAASRDRRTQSTD
jgi:hypothetical protein